jgi:uncharacterized NAD(P)/FAD-binding protein YdhS
LADEPDHFVRWLARIRPPGVEIGGPEWPAQAFVPRGVYGRYVAETLEEARRAAAPDVALRTVRGRAVGAAFGADVALTLRTGERLRVDRVVLCTGHETHGAFPLVPAEHRVDDPWAPHALDAIGADQAVVLLGTGLTMVDVALSLVSRGHRGPLVALSRRGLLPRAHAPAAPPKRWLPADAPHTARGLLRRLRDEIGARGDWRAVFDGLRPDLQALWQGLPQAERARLLRHARPWWDVHRHRMAPAIARRVEDLLAEGRLRVLAGRALGWHDGRLRVCLRGGHALLAIPADRVVDCTGPETDCERTRDPLLRSLLDQGLARPDPLRLGLDVTPEGALIGPASGRLFAVGPLTRAALWEITAVPEIRRQAAALALRLTRP